MRFWPAYGSPTLGHASRILVGSRIPGISITPPLSNHHRRRRYEDGVESVMRRNRLGHIIAKSVKGDKGSHLPQTMPTLMKAADVYQRWTIIAPGPSIVSLIVPFLTFSDFYSMQRRQ